MPIVYFIGMIAMLGFGAGVLWINWRRLVNQVFAGICLLCALYFAFTIMARYHAHRYHAGGPFDGLVWVRLTWTTTACMPLYLWALYYIVSGRFRNGRNLLRKLAPWAIVTAVLGAMTWTQFFITNESVPDHRTVGPGFWVFQVVVNVVSVWILVRSLVVAPKLTGIRKLEFQYLTINCAALSLFAVLLPLLTFLPVPARKLVTLPIVCYGISGWSIAARRVYDSTHIYATLVVRSAVLLAVGFGALWTIEYADRLESNTYARVAIIVVFCLAGWAGDDLFRRWFWLKPEQQMLARRKHLARMGEDETSPELLLERFQATLAAWTQADRVAALRLVIDRYVGDDISLSAALLDRAAAFSEGWVTTSSLARVPGGPDDAALRAFLTSHNLKALIAADWSDHRAATLFGFGERPSGAPFTYPEVRRLQQLVEVADGCYTKGVLRSQAQRSEQLRAWHTDRLATLGFLASQSAHEARNRLEAIRAGLELLAEGREADLTPEHRQLLLKTADDFANEFSLHLDLARVDGGPPELLPVDTVIDESLVAMRWILSARQIDVERRPCGPRAIANVNRRLLRQVLINVVKNAIDSTGQVAQPKLCVWSVVDDHQVAITVADNGAGVAPEVRDRLFREFVTTKPGGTGLGLSICRRIMAEMNGSIEFVPSGPLPGAAVRIALPLAEAAVTSA